LKKKLSMALLIAVVAVTMVVGVAHALEVEVPWIDNPNGWTYSLDYIGFSPGECDWNDYGFAVVKTFSSNPSDWAIYSYDQDTHDAFYGKSVHAYDAETPYDAYICTGFTETWAAGGPGEVESHLFIWVR